MSSAGQSIYEQKSSRVDQSAFRRRGIRARSWLVALIIGVVVGGGLLTVGSRQQNTVYECAPVSDAHRMFENDCTACHEPWQGPWMRLMSLDFSSEIRSVSDSKCEVCHSGAAHHPGNASPHGFLHCADCHREHRGQAELAEVSDRACIQCHAELEHHGSSGVFASRITGLSSESGHPEFALHRALEPGSSQVPFATGGFRKLAVDYLPAGDHPQPLRKEEETLQPPEKPQRLRWQDPGMLRFNHSKHLRQEGIRDFEGKTVFLADNCQHCHTPAADGRYMQPIHYETHCRQCHPLDPHDRYGHSERFHLPHEEPEIVLGFLIHALSAAESGKKKGSPGNTEQSFPGVLYLPSLSEPETEELRQHLEDADDYIQLHIHSRFGEEAKGGCRYCHEVQSNPAGPARKQPHPGGLGLDARIEAGWKIVRTSIPERWMHHGEFDHSPHRAISCRECHQARTTDGLVVPVDASRQTSDVLIPGIDNCRKCHSQDSNADSTRLQPAGTACTECHVYHDRNQSEGFRGRLNFDLKQYVGPAGEP